MRGARELLLNEKPSRMWRTLLGWLVVVVVLVTVVTTAINWVFVDRDPEDPVDSWLNGLENGRSRQLLSRLDAVLADPTLEIFSNRIYRNAAGRVSDHEILDVRQNGDRAEVRVRVAWDGDDGSGRPAREEVHTYRVHRLDRTGPLNNRWELDSLDAALVTVHLPALLDELSVNGQSVRLDADERVPDPEGPGGTWRFEALPGDYAIGLPGNSYYEVADPLAPRTVAFRDPDPVSVALEIQPSPRMWRETDERIRAWLEDCMESDRLVPEGCPSSQRYSAEGAPLVPAPVASLAPDRRDGQISDVEWQLVSRPALVLVPDPEDPLRWSADPYRPAEARLSYREDGEQVVERVEFPVRATVRSTGQIAEISVGLE